MNGNKAKDEVKLPNSFGNFIESKSGAFLSFLRKISPSSWQNNTFSAIFPFLLVVSCAASLLILRSVRGEIIRGFEFFFDHLPLMLPIMTVVLSIMLRPDQLRGKAGWLNLCNHFSLGLVSFAIWAFVAGQSSGQYIYINESKVLNRDHSLLLIFGSFIWAGFCSVISALAEIEKKDEKNKNWMMIQLMLVSASFSLMLVPFWIFENKAQVEQKIGRSLDTKVFLVSIPYQDPSLDQHLGRVINPLMQCQIYDDIVAKTNDEAIKIAMSRFVQSREYDQYFQRVNSLASENKSSNKVSIKKDAVIASDRN